MLLSWRFLVFILLERFASSHFSDCGLSLPLVCGALERQRRRFSAVKWCTHDPSQLLQTPGLPDSRLNALNTTRLGGNDTPLVARLLETRSWSSRSLGVLISVRTVESVELGQVVWD